MTPKKNQRATQDTVRLSRRRMLRGAVAGAVGVGVAVTRESSGTECNDTEDAKHLAHQGYLP